jgi:hypothetical protein
LWHLVVWRVVADVLKYQNMLAQWHIVTSQKAWFFSNTAVRAWNLASITSFMLLFDVLYEQNSKLVLLLLRPLFVCIL